MILQGDCREVMRNMEPESVDSIVTDPPYELNFMGREWDRSGVAFDADTWRECLRVLKPGGHLLAFGGSRTFHRIAVAIEDAGFEIRDTISWMYGSGFPKSLDVSKAIDKAAGEMREVVGYDDQKARQQTGQNNTASLNDRIANNGAITAPATPEAEQWQGWGTALKPAWEPVIVARKPFSGTVAHNVLTYGTGAINIDASRIGTSKNVPASSSCRMGANGIYGGGMKALEERSGMDPNIGRWPANVILDEDAAAMLDAATGVTTSTGGTGAIGRNEIYGTYGPKPFFHYGDTGGASRFFYTSKSSRSERNAGLEGLPEKVAKSTGWSGDSMPLRQDGSERKTPMGANNHPTVKPLSLMRYLITLVTPPGGIVLDPFAGSGSTLVAAAQLGFGAIGIELTEEYLPIIRGRVAHEESKGRQVSLFDYDR